MESPNIPLGLRDVRSKPKGSSSKAKKGPKKATAVKRKQEAKELDSEEERRKKIRRIEAAESRKAKKAMEDEKADNRVNIGLDVGTTFSALAMAYGKCSPDKITVLNEWPGERHRTEDKCPSKIAYASENDLPRNNWGYEVQAKHVSYSWWKLLLDKNTKRTDFDHPLLESAIGANLMRLPEGKTAMEVMTDYLRSFQEYFMGRLKESMLETALDDTEIRVVVTVPATWQHAAREATRQAVRKAGFVRGPGDEIIVIDEPEAAGLSVIRTIENSPSAEYLKPETIIICVDAGGGTLDLSSLFIKKLDPLQLEEACVGEGGKAGGTTIDRECHALMHQRFGDAFTSLPYHKTGPGSDFMKSLEEIKRNFSHEDNDEIFELPLKMKLLDETEHGVFYNFEEDTVKLSSNDIKAMFDKVLEKMFGLLQSQIEKTNPKEGCAAPKRIIAACGGLNRNNYVFDQLKRYVKDSLALDNIHVMRPMNPWSAVAEGAVLSAMGKSPVISRRSRNHILIDLHTEFDPDKHRQSDRYECPRDGPRALNQLKCIVDRGEKLTPETKKKVSCYHVVEDVRAEIQEVVVKQHLYRSCSEVAPERVDDDGVVHLGTIEVDITLLAREERARIKARKGPKGRWPKYMEFNVDIHLTMSGDKGVLEAIAMSGRRQVGCTKIKYAPAPAWKSTLVHEDEDEEDDEENEAA